jgi:cysteine desulfurase
MNDDVIYLDHNASTPCDPRVVEAMTPYLTRVFANPSSRNHGPGREAAQALEEARAAVARALGARSATEIVFTSGATESNNLALRGAAASRSGKRRRFVSQETEHPSVAEPLQRLQREGWDLTILPVDGVGRVAPDDVADALDDTPALVSVMLANNETGTIQPAAEVFAAARERGAISHCDAAQAAGKIPLDLEALGADLVSVCGHKIYGPNGVGCLYVRRRKPPLALVPLVDGGGHENGLRSGTPNVAGAVGLAAALEIAVAEMAADAARLAALRDRLESALLEGLDGCTVNGDPSHRLPGTTNISFAGIEGNALLASLPDIAVSSGSACTTTHPEASPVLRSMGLAPDLAKASLRIGVGRFSTENEVDRAVTRIIAEVERLRQLARRRSRGKSHSM